MEIEFRTIPRDHSAMASPAHNQVSREMFAEMQPERIGYRLSLLRRAKGLQKSQMADILDIERTYWSRFENGKRPLSNGVAALITERFGVTLDFLILGKWDKLPLDLAEVMRNIERRNSASRLSPDEAANKAKPNNS